jgi:hypothetical protein
VIVSILAAAVKLAESSKSADAANSFPVGSSNGKMSGVAVKTVLVAVSGVVVATVDGISNDEVAISNDEVAISGVVVAISGVVVAISGVVVAISGVVVAISSLGVVRETSGVEVELSASVKIAFLPKKNQPEIKITAKKYIDIFGNLLAI